MAATATAPTSALVAAAQAKTEKYLERIDQQRAHTLGATDLEGAVAYEKKYVGKVRDVYTTKDSLILVSTDRQSAFDRNLASIPFKGQVLNLTSQWWFEQTKALVPNHILAVPHPNACVGKKCTVFPVEFVMRGYITGSTGTSLWTNYAKGVRQYCGHALPDGLVKNQKLAQNLLTPTTKDDTHDELISAEEIVATGRMSQADWDLCSKYAQELFAYGQKVAEDRGLILVDTKYEFGKDAEGNIIIIDEVHTPDSSRYWVKETYADRQAQGLEPENIDKEFLRLWFKDRCDPYKDATLPEAPPELVNELSRRYIMLYELITGLTFEFPPAGSSTNDSLRAQLGEYYKDK